MKLQPYHIFNCSLTGTSPFMVRVFIPTINYYLLVSKPVELRILNYIVFEGLSMMIISYIIKPSLCLFSHIVKSHQIQERIFSEKLVY